jgi:hypothetical protein
MSMVNTKKPGIISGKFKIRSDILKTKNNDQSKKKEKRKETSWLCACRVSLQHENIVKITTWRNCKLCSQGGFFFVVINMQLKSSVQLAYSIISLTDYSWAQKKMALNLRYLLRSIWPRWSILANTCAQCYSSSAQINIHIFKCIRGWLLPWPWKVKLWVSKWLYSLILTFSPTLNRNSGPGKVPLIITEGLFVQSADITFSETSSTTLLENSFGLNVG